MVYDKSCPGSRTIREPRPEYINCPDCGAEVEIWTDELKAICSSCGNKVYRAQQASCIDWCPHAKECVGPEVYERLKPGVEDDLPGSGSPLAILEREHERTLETLSLLRGASLCLKLGALKPGTPIREKGIDHLSKVLDFFEKDLGLHFRREEEVLFPALEKHIGVEKSPTRLLLREHNEFWQYYDHLKEKLAELKRDGNEHNQAISAELEDISRHIGNLLPQHIKRENESLLPLASRLLAGKELEATSQKLRSLK